jgi:hypothetical protein
VVAFVRNRRIHGRGIGWIDAHLLASSLVGRLKLWTTDPRLMAAAKELGVAYDDDAEEPLCPAQRVQRLGGTNHGDAIRIRYAQRIRLGVIPRPCRTVTASVAWTASVAVQSGARRDGIGGIYGTVSSSYSRELTPRARFRPSREALDNAYRTGARERWEKPRQATGALRRTRIGCRQPGTSAAATWTG